MTSDEFKSVRESLGLSRFEMAEAIGVEERTIRNYENGTRSVSNTVAILMYLLMTIPGALKILQNLKEND